VGLHYNRFAGQSVARLAALSDGVFAIAMTLLVLDLHEPATQLVHSEADLLAGLRGISPSLVAYFMSFLTLGIFWVGQQTQLNSFARTDRDLTWMQLAFLLPVALMPFSTRLLSAFITYRTALLAYWFNIFLLGSALLLSRVYAARRDLFRDDFTAAMRAATLRRILVAQTLYLFGAVLCVFSTYVSIAFIVLVQLNYVLAPRVWPLNRL
jgi:uncharacterized membrane protein